MTDGDTEALGGRRVSQEHRGDLVCKAFSCSPCLLEGTIVCAKCFVTIMTAGSAGPKAEGRPDLSQCDNFTPQALWLQQGLPGLG